MACNHRRNIKIFQNKSWNQNSSRLQCSYRRRRCFKWWKWKVNVQHNGYENHSIRSSFRYFSIGQFVWYNKQDLGQIKWIVFWWWRFKAFSANEFGSFKQRPNKNLEQTVNLFNHLLSRLLKNNLKHQDIEQKVTFLNSLRSEWKRIMSIAKAHEQFKNYFGKISCNSDVSRRRSHERNKTHFWCWFIGVGY